MTHERQIHVKLATTFSGHRSKRIKWDTYTPYRDWSHAVADPEEDPLLPWIPPFSTKVGMSQSKWAWLKNFQTLCTHFFDMDPPL